MSKIVFAILGSTVSLMTDTQTGTLTAFCSPVMAGAVAYPLQEDFCVGCIHIAIQEVLQAGLRNSRHVIAKAKVHVDDGLKALVLGGHGYVLLLASGKIDRLCHPCLECFHL